MSLPKGQTVCLINLGCAKNLVDSEVLLGLLAEAGYIPYPDPAMAEVILINTCGFIQPARSESRKVIREALRHKKRDPNKRIGVLGCYVEKEKESLKQLFPEIDFWLGVKELEKIVPAIQGQDFSASRYTFLYRENMPRLLSTPPVWAYVKIAEGCSHGCSFCTIPAIKGAYRSRPLVSVINEVKALAEAGVKEINLISQDTTYYGRDRGKRHELATLLEALVKIPGIAWVRWLYGFPEEINESLLKIMTEPKICPYFDLPFQHSSRSVLKLMRRGFDGRQALRLLERIRRYLPDATFRTSLIVGFPGEGKREFQDLVNFVREAEFDHLGVFVYSPEPGTEAYSLGDPIADQEKKRRRHEIMALQAEISRRRLKRFLGRKMEALIDGTTNKTKTIYYGRTKYQAPEVDGGVKIPWPEGKKPPAPGLGWVEIIKTGRYDLRGCWLG